MLAFPGLLSYHPVRYSWARPLAIAKKIRGESTKGHKMKWIGPLVILIAVIASNAYATDPSAKAQAGDVLAQIGNHPITREMLDNIIETIPEENRVPFLTPDGRKKILDEVVTSMVFAEAAKAQGIDKEAPVKTRLNYVQTEYLAGEYFRRQLAKSPPLSEKDLQAYFEEHKSEFTPPEEIKARHILVKTEAQANKILGEIKSGKDFAELAKKNSIDPAAAQGGKLTLPDGREWLPRGTFEHSFEESLFNIPKGQIGGPIKTQFGWHILKVEDRRKPDPPAFVQVRGSIYRKLQDQKITELRKQLMEQLKKTIPVEIK